MGWEHDAGGRGGDRPGGKNGRAGDLNTVAAVCAAQLPAVVLGQWMSANLGDYHGSSYNSLALFVLIIVLAAAPVLLPLAGLVHALLHIVPGRLLAQTVTRHVRGPMWVWHLVCTALLGVGWAVLGAVVWGWAFTVAAPLLAGAGVLPVVGLAHYRGRAGFTGRRRGFTATWFTSFLASGALCVLVLVGGLLGHAAGLVGYRPPELSSGQLTGDWHGTDGAVLRLEPGGTAVLTRMAADPEREPGAGHAGPARCDGPATWSKGEWADEAAVVVRLGGTCGRDTWWTIGGTKGEPELYARFGDPDAGELWILRRR